MIRLNEDQKHIFEKNVKDITPKDEQRVLDNIDQEIDNLTAILEKQASSKTEELINNAKVLLEILRTKDFPITESSRKWIVFGLNYLISDFDLIPDSIPRIGYLDDALVISWVKQLIDNDITRFKIYQRAKSLSERSGILKQMIQGEGRTEVVLIPGFLSNDFYSENYTEWVQSVMKSKFGEEKAGLSILDWKTNYTPEFHKTLLMVDHDLKLKPQYDSDAFEVDWKQLKRDFSSISKIFFHDIAEIKKQSPDKKIVVICFNIGTFIIDNPDYEKQLELIDDYYIFGGCSIPEYVSKAIHPKVKNIYNFYNYQDATLKFIYENYEQPKVVVGLAAIQSGKNNKLKNISLGTQQRRHIEYKDNLSNLIDSI